MNYLKNNIFIISLLFAFQVSLAQVGINTVEPKSTLDINGNLSLKTIGIPAAFSGGSSGSATLINDGVYISLTPTTPAPEFYIDDASKTPGRIYILRNISTSVTAKVFCAPPSLFFPKDAVAFTGSMLSMPSNGSLKTVILISDGQNWTYFY